MSITASALLTEMNISVWTANKLDRVATQTVIDTNSAAKNAAQVRKNLMAGTSVRKEIADYAAGCRLWHNTRTLPWSDKGVRLIPTSLFIPYKEELNVRRATFNSMVDNFIDAYPTLVQASRACLGSLFDETDYPSAEEVRSKFGFKVVFSPVPEAGDFRIDVSQHDLDEVREEYEAAFQLRLSDAMREPWNRLHTVLQSISTKLTDAAEGDEKTKRYHDTLLTNAQDLCGLLGHLNVTNDPGLDDARRALEGAITGVDMGDIREDALVRASVKEKIDNILKGFEW